MARAFLIGAGATKAQYDNAPLSADFLDLLRKRHNSLYSELFKCANDLSLDGDISRYNVEDFVRHLEGISISRGITFRDCLYKALYHLLAESTESTNQHMKDYVATGNYQSPRNHFYNLLNDPRFDIRNDYFITLNYDLCIEREILALGKSIYFGADELFAGPNDLFSAGSEQGDIILGSREDSITVLHLHGALNWELAHEKIFPRYGAVLPSLRRDNLNLCLLAPGEKVMNKYLSPIWLTAKELLYGPNPSTDELIIIGCSLNPIDTQLAELIRIYAKARGTSGIKIIYWEQYPARAQHIQYANLIGEGFKEYVFGFDLMGPNGGALEFIYE